MTTHTDEELIAIAKNGTIGQFLEIATPAKFTALIERAQAAEARARTAEERDQQQSLTIRALRHRNENLEMELRLWRSLVSEGGVPRYTVTHGAALNSVVTSTDRLLRTVRSDNAKKES